jgi:hypothetical protein
MDPTYFFTDYAFPSIAESSFYRNEVVDERAASPSGFSTF